MNPSSRHGTTTCTDGDTEFDLTIIVISYNSGQLVIDNLDSVVNSRRWLTQVIDNNSSDNSFQLMSKHFQPEQLIALPRNEGYGRAANVALMFLKTRYALLLNPDIAVDEKTVADFVHHAINTAPDAAIIAPATRPEEQCHCGMLAQRDVLGAAMLFDREQFKDIGWFDEHLFLYYEEKDLCRRVIEAGKAIYLDSEHYFVHAKGSSSGNSNAIAYLKHWHVGWSSCYYLKKHGLNHGRQGALAMLLRYSTKALFYHSASARLKYRARSAGVSAFLRGKGPFDAEGHPRAQPY
ncbi:MAG: glycosyltransferase [Parahaliea sp.]